MKMKKGFLKKALSLLLALALTASYLPIAWQATAVTGDAYGESGNKIADPSTVNDWKLFFDIEDPDNLDTSYAGSVWTDKSVFNTVADYIAATDETEGANFPLALTDDNNFLVALSAIASTKSVEGYSSLPSDTVLVLDLSASMITNQAVSTLVSSANDAIAQLQALNANNRVGVVAYSGNSEAGTSGTGTAEVILPIGRYTPGLDSNNRSAYLVSSWVTGSGRDRVNHTGVKVANGVTGTLAEGITSSFSTNNSKDADGGTYIQNGLYQAWQLFSQVDDTSIQEGLQAGVDRVPVMVLMSDGAPTAATTNYTEVGASNVGTGTSTYATNGTAFLTQLTASWVRDKLEQKYSVDPLVYTLGLGVGNNAAARNLLDPSNNTGTDGLWSRFTALANAANKRMTVEITNQVDATITYTAPVNADDGWSEDYVTEYFPASNAAGLSQAFNNIVEQIIIQSLYYPTMVESGNTIDEDGFLTFEDYIGKNMEVKAIKGIQLGDTLYTGQTLARMIYSGGMGTVENPTDAGNNLVWSVQKRLQIDTVLEARELLGQAYAAGQLAYDPDTGAFSNYIGWYADENEKFVGFWDGQDASPAAVPDELKDKAVFAIKSYGFFDAVGEGHRETNMMYATIQVRTNVANPDTLMDASEVGDVRLIGRLPASLIPLVEYNVELNGTDVMDPASITVSGATAPRRLLYEVGLSSKIDLLDIAGTAPDPLQTDANGNYVFYTNQWHDNTHYTYATNRNTTTFFEPSIDNERYYYNYDTPIYTDQSGTLYTGATAPVYSESAPFYHRTITYHNENGQVRAEYTYEQISQYVLDEVSDLKKLDDNTWVVKRGTIHHYFGDYIVPKTDNATGTLGVSDQPFVHEPEEGVTLGYHIDSYLGNNGKLTLDPAEGIRITKISDDTITDKTTDYTFTVTTDAGFNETLRLVRQDAAGNRTESTITFTGGSATVTLKHGETAWILGSAMVGKTFTVTEAEGDGYVVASVNGSASQSSASLPVTANNIGTAAFVNTRQHTGSVVMSKAVISSIADHQNKEFSFVLKIEGSDLVAGRGYTAIRSDGTVYSVIPGTDTTVTLKHNQYITLSGLPGGTTVTATESDYSGVGFTVNQATQTATVVTDDTVWLNFSNTYGADSTDGSGIAVRGTKHFVSDTAWNATFNFKLQRYIWADSRYEDVTGGSASVTYTGEKDDKTFAFDFSGETYTAAGTYYYRIIEVADSTLASQGVIFDPTPAHFSVVVADDGEGSLYIADVVAGTDATVMQDTNTSWTVSGEFTNTYAGDGAVEVVLNMKKTIASDYGVTIPPAGFSFELYDADENWNITGTSPAATSSVTGAGGISDIPLVYDDAENDIGTYYYVLKETVPADADKITGVTYSTEKYGVKVVVGHESGNFTVAVTTYDLNGTAPTEIETVNGSGAAGVITANLTAVEFTNTFVPTPVTLDLGGTKTLTGKDSSTGFTFRLYSTGSDFSTEGQAYTTASTATHTDGQAVAFAFSQLSYSRPGTYYYVVTEEIPADAANNVKDGITYDASEYHITVTVTGDDQTGNLSVSYTVTKNGNAAPITFVNTYKAAPATGVVLEGTKTLNGDIRKLQANAYHFELVDEAGNVVQTVGNETPIGDYDAFFTFAGLTFDTAGTYHYTIREKLHPEATAANNYTVHGVKYDTRTYPVTIVVEDPGTGELTAEVTYENLPDGADIPAFENTYSVSPTSYTISGTKVLTGDDIAKYTDADAFGFALYAASWDADAKIVVEGDMLAFTFHDTDGAFSFSPSDIAELNFSHIGAYRFILREMIPANGDPLMNYDPSYFLYEIDVTDNLSGGLTATAQVTKVDEKGESTRVNASEVAFENVYDAEPISVPLSGIKTFNLDLPADTFSFDLYQALKGADGSINAVGSPILTAWNQADGTFRFEEQEVVDQLSGLTVMTSYLTFEKAGTYYFVVKENIPEGVDANNTLNGVTYDTAVYEITITVTESDVDGRATLSYLRQINGDANGHLIFANTYDAAGENGVTISGEKILTGRDLKDGEFTFGLYSATVNADGTVIIGDLIEEKKNTDGKFTFSEVTYPTLENAGRHYYLIREQIPEGADENGTLNGITYDRKQYLVVVDVTDNGDGTMTVSDPALILVEDGKVSQTSATEIFFRNVYTPTTPDTGDHSQPTLWAALLALSVLGMGAVLTIGKKKMA